eukprot:scaffold7221_cov313-Prasinococcus_capsulatus_cf.AAC.3
MCHRRQPPLHAAASPTTLEGLYRQRLARVPLSPRRLPQGRQPGHYQRRKLLRRSLRFGQRLHLCILRGRVVGGRVCVTAGNSHCTRRRALRDWKADEGNASPGYHSARVNCRRDDNSNIINQGSFFEGVYGSGNVGIRADYAPFPFGVEDVAHQSGYTDHFALLRDCDADYVTRGPAACAFPVAAPAPRSRRSNAAGCVGLRVCSTPTGGAKNAGLKGHGNEVIGEHDSDIGASPIDNFALLYGYGADSVAFEGTGLVVRYMTGRTRASRLETPRPQVDALKPLVACVSVYAAHRLIARSAYGCKESGTQ